MITTEGGLFVAIPTLFAHNYLASRIRALVTELEEASQTLLDSLTAVRTVPRRTDVPVSK
jgi:biopolymer transport protein ExbB/TolQ